MGILNFNKLVKDILKKANVPKDKSPFTSTKLSTLNGKKVAIDISLLICQGAYRNNVSKIPGLEVSPVDSIVRSFLKWVQFGITPIGIFDGKPPKEKRHTIDDRIEKKESTKNKIEELEKLKCGFVDGTSVMCSSGRSYSTIDALDAQMEKLNKRILNVRREHFEDCKRLFDLMGVPYIEANGEAEGLCARLVKEGYADAAVSQDTDLYPCGSTQIIKDFSSSKDIVTVCDLPRLLEIMDVTQDQLIDICILCGCDYLKKKIPRVGPMTAYNKIKNYGSIETFIAVECGEDGKYIVPDEFDYISARELFRNSGMETELEGVSFNMKTPNVGQLMLFCEPFKLGSKWISYIEGRYFLDVKKMCKTSTLDSFFSSRSNSLKRGVKKTVIFSKPKKKKEDNSLTTNGGLIADDDVVLI